MSSSNVKVDDCENLVHSFSDLSIEQQNENQQNETRNGTEVQQMGSGSRCHGGTCAICLDSIVLQETALIKGCEHAYCVTCILQWVTYSKEPTCPQCKHPFGFLSVHRSLDGSLQDYLLEESVCLLLRASWFKPLAVEDHKFEAEPFNYIDDYHLYDEEDDLDDDDDEVYYPGSSSIRIGNRKWGENGYVRAGRQEARPVHRHSFQDGGASSSREPRKEVAKSMTGRRAKRALKREAADKAAAAKHLQHLARMGRSK